MTGNMVLLGLAAGTGNGVLAARAGAAIIAFVIGCGIGGRLAGRHEQGDGVWPRPVTRALTVEFVLFVVFASAMQAVAGHPHGTVLKTGLLSLNAVALGVQSGAVQRFGVSGLSTTYLTGTLTTTIVHLSQGRPVRQVGLNLGLLACLITGAGVAALIATHAARVSPALQIGGVGLVILIARRAGRADVDHGARP